MLGRGGAPSPKSSEAVPLNPCASDRLSVGPRRLEIGNLTLKARDFIAAGVRTSTTDPGAEVKRINRGSVSAMEKSAQSNRRSSNGLREGRDAWQLAGDVPVIWQS
jgi:hypothetical protein